MTFCPNEQIGSGPVKGRTTQGQESHEPVHSGTDFSSHVAFSWKERGWFTERGTVAHMGASLSPFSLAQSHLSGALFKVLLVLCLKEQGGLTCERPPWSTLQATCCPYLPAPLTPGFRGCRSLWHQLPSAGHPHPGPL